MNIVMAYIPTIHTFEDDINENIGIGGSQEEKGVESITPKESILIPEKQKSSTNFFVVFLSIILIFGAIGIVGYYYYTNMKNKQLETSLNADALAKQEAEKAREEESVVNNLKSIFPTMATDISKYVDSAVKKDGIIIVTIKKSDNGVDNYSQLYTYILAHQKDLGRDLVDTFNLNNIVEDISNYEMPTSTPINETLSTTTKIVSTSSNNTATKNKKETTKTNNASSSNLENVVDFFNPESLQKNFNTLITDMSTPKPISGEDLEWESKTLNNQDFQIANAGVVTLIYGYVKQDYLVFSISLKDFFSTIKSLD